MDRKKVPIVLVFSFSPSCCEKLNEILVRLGFTNIDKLEWNDLLNANMDHFKNVFVIPVSQKNVLSRKMKPGLETIRKMPVIGVIQAHEKNFDNAATVRFAVGGVARIAWCRRSTSP